MRIDTLFYRFIWRLKKWVGVKNPGPAPIQWHSHPIRQFKPPEKFKESLDAHQLQILARVLDELDILTRIYTYLPRDLTYKDWATLIRLNSTGERFTYIHFLRNKERKREREKDLQKNKTARSFPLNCKSSDVSKVEESKATSSENATKIHKPSAYFILPPRKIIELEREHNCIRYIRSLQLALNGEIPRVAVDCRFLLAHSQRGLNLTMLQFRHLFSENKIRPEPWPIWLTNYDTENPILLEHKKRHLEMTDSKHIYCGEITSQSYLELFPSLQAQKKIVYLSPHADESLSEINADTCYVIGGIVDRYHEPKIPQHASKLIAAEEELSCKKFPLDEYLIWKRGTQMLTLPCVLKILQGVYDTGGDWKWVLERSIPAKKLREKKLDKDVRSKCKNIYKHKVAILKILEEKLGSS